ncbi:unnamed protein product [Caenorhabditis bovis]|uniref:Uncharacterized protein n=1 Tax=Caenorhabditis bovis TaxID=2654633 RepID=A0A8S1EUQ1_9PELO|nr:unnamed protein product [Caenorhabditis bovis]
MSVIKTISVACFVLWIFFSYFTKSWIESGHEHQIGNRRRIISALRMECLLTFLNVVAYNELMRWFDIDGTSKEKLYERRSTQVRNAVYLSKIFLS